MVKRVLGLPIKNIVEMKNNQNFLVTLLARGGSKRIPRKNIKLFLGKPIITYPLNLVKNFSRELPIHISTEDKEISEFVNSIGHKLDFMRPESLALDSTPALDVIDFIIKKYKEKGIEFTHVINIPPTSVFCTKKILNDSIKLSEKNQKKIIIPVKEFNVPIESSYLLNSQNNILSPYSIKNFTSNTQNFKKNVYDAGILAIIPTEILSHRNNNEIIADSLIGLKINDFVIDIDYEEEWLLAEKFLKFMSI